MHLLSVASSLLSLCVQEAEERASAAESELAGLRQQLDEVVREGGKEQAETVTLLQAQVCTFLAFTPASLFLSSAACIRKGHIADTCRGRKHVFWLQRLVLSYCIIVSSYCIIVLSY
jgi:hypothetical protein